MRQSLLSWNFECAQMVGHRERGARLSRALMQAGLQERQSPEPRWVESSPVSSTGAQEIPRRLEAQGKGCLSQWMGVGALAALRTIPKQPETR